MTRLSKTELLKTKNHKSYAVKTVRAPKGGGGGNDGASSNGGGGAPAPGAAAAAPPLLVSPKRQLVNRVMNQDPKAKNGLFRVVMASQQVGTMPVGEADPDANRCSPKDMTLARFVRGQLIDSDTASLVTLNVAAALLIRDHEPDGTPRKRARSASPTPALAGPAAPAERPVATAEIVALVAEVGIPPLFQADTASRLADAGFTTEADVKAMWEDARTRAKCADEIKLQSIAHAKLKLYFDNVGVG